jgi:DNA-binding LytR/AlgR family response regulator
MKLRCIVVDDEPLALDILEEYIRRTPVLELAGRFTSGADALARLRTGGVDLAFLDIQMPGTGGLEVAKQIAEAGETRVVFTTAFSQYAIDGFEVDALDYLLKPIGFDEFSRAVGRAVEWFSRRGVVAAKRPDTLTVKSDYKQIVIPLTSIVRVEGTRDYVRIHLDDGRSVQSLMTLRGVEEMLSGGRFARVHRSHIVSLDRVRRLERGRVVVAGVSEESIPISDTYRESFFKCFNRSI